MSAAKGLKVVGYFDCPGGGQVVVRDGVAYIGHVKPPHRDEFSEALTLDVNPSVILIERALFATEALPTL